MNRMAATTPMPINPDTMDPRSPAVMLQGENESTCALEDGSASESTDHRSEVVASAIQRVQVQLVSGLFGDCVHDRYA